MPRYQKQPWVCLHLHAQWAVSRACYTNNVHGAKYNNVLLTFKDTPILFYISNGKAEALPPLLLPLATADGGGYSGMLPCLRSGRHARLLARVSSSAHSRCRVCRKAGVWQISVGQQLSLPLAWQDSGHAAQGKQAHHLPSGAG